MAQHNPQSRAFLLIVLGAVLVCFIIAMLLFGGGDSETAGEADPQMEHKAQDMDRAPAPEVPARTMSDDMTPPPEEMADDVSPPDEMVDEPMLDDAPDAPMPGETPESASPETPPADNP